MTKVKHIEKQLESNVCLETVLKDSSVNKKSENIHTPQLFSNRETHEEMFLNITCILLSPAYLTIK